MLIKGTILSLIMNLDFHENRAAEALEKCRQHAIEQLELLVAHLEHSPRIDWRFVRTHAESLASHAGDAISAAKSVDCTDHGSGATQAF